MEELLDASWTPTFIGLMDELVHYIYAMCDPLTLYYAAWTCRRFQRLAKAKSLKLCRRLQERAIVQLRKDNYVEALIAFNRILSLFPNSYKAWRKRSDCFSHTYEYVAAYNDLVRALQCCAKPAKYQLILSSIYCMEGKNQEAWEAANNAVLLDPANPRYYHQRAYVQASLAAPGDLDSEQKELDDYLKILKMPYDAHYMVHNNIGYTHFLRQEDDLAEQHFTQALEGCPYFIKALINRADLRYFTNQMRESIEDCRTVTQINPYFYEAYWLQGSNYFNQQQFTKAFNAYHTAFHLCEFYNEQVVLPFFALAVKLGRVDMCFEEMHVILDFYERLIAAAQEQLHSLEQLQAQSRTQAAEWTAHEAAAVRALSQLVVHNHDAKPAYYREVFERNIANKDRLVLREPFTAEHIASMITLIKRKVTGHYALYELVLLKYVELNYLYGAFDEAERARVKLAAVCAQPLNSKNAQPRTHHVIDLMRELALDKLTPQMIDTVRALLRRSTMTTYDTDEYIFNELKPKHNAAPLASVDDGKFLLLAFTYKTLHMRLHDADPLCFSDLSLGHIRTAFTKLALLATKPKLMTAHQLVSTYEFQDTSY